MNRCTMYVLLVCCRSVLCCSVTFKASGEVAAGNLLLVLLDSSEVVKDMSQLEFEVCQPNQPARLFSYLQLYLHVRVY